MSEHWHSNPTQIYWTCHALLQGRTITHLDEIGEVRGWRLGAIVHRLRASYGWPITTDYVGPERIAHYRLSKACHVVALRFPRSAQPLRRKVMDGALGGALGGKPAHGRTAHG
ncbi:hypothetical protein [Palleronia sp. LCG004]|uniref:hypothetical protein n=1 Tax=Palleronia sp. LCG004 TaxID=3079304 RepID=UPI002943E574|nr:hypothetical protein [Palleronia sp. LCG004]WOI55590.1 hypothetical protein RVY76_11130 [Palleronia sp. LCG004]